MQESYVTIATYQNAMKADLAKTMLEAEGISVYLHNFNIVWADALLSNAVGSIKLQVPQSQSERAERILYEMPNRKTPTDAAFDEVYCLNCGKAMSEEQDRCDDCGWSYGDEADDETAS